MSARLRRLLVVIVTVLSLSSIGRAGGVTGFAWTPIGPQPDCCFFNGGETGRTTAVAANPANPDDIWIGTAGGGVWHTLNGGTTWAPMTDTQASLAIGAIALAGCTATGGCAYVYAGTGENAIRRDTYYGAGLLVGTSAGGAGYTWTLRNGKPLYDFTRGSIYNVVLDPATSGGSQVIYITLSSGVTASATESTVTAPEPSPGGWGIYRSTDNGSTWTKLMVAGSARGTVNGRPTDLELNPANHSVLYAGFLSRGLFKSTDGGVSWCPLSSGIPKPVGCPATSGLPDPASVLFDHVEVDLFRGNPDHLYATLGNCPDRLVDDCEPSVWESTNGGLTWINRYAGSPDPTTSEGDMPCPRAYTRYMHGLTISPTDGGTIFLTGYHLCRSDDHGESFYAIDWNTKGGKLHPDHHAILFHPTNTSRAYDVNDGGIALSFDGGSNWTPSTAGGLNAIEFQSLATSPATDTIFGGTQDNGGMAWTGSKGWQNLQCCGDGGFAAYETFNVGGLYDKTDLYITSNLNPVGTSVVLPLRSTDWGKNWFSPGVPPVSYDLGLDAYEPRSFYPPLLLGGGYELFGTGRLYTSVSQLQTMTARSPVLSADLEPEIWKHTDVITAIAVAPSNPNRFYMGYYSGKVFRSDGPCSDASCWTQVGSPGGPVTWLSVDTNAADTVYATVSGFAPGVHAFKSTSAGVSWVPTGSLAELNGVPANTIVPDPGASGTLYLGTDHGIYKSTTAGGSWFRYSPGLPNVPVYQVVFDASRGRVFAATHGRGAYTLGPVYTKSYVDGPVKKLVLDQPVFGGGYLPSQSCLVKVMRQDGSVCASGRNDAFGGTITTDADGVLVSSKPNVYSNLPLVWACAQGSCLGSAAKNCMLPGNPIGSVSVNCGGAIGFVTQRAVPSTPGPPSSRFTLGGVDGSPLGHTGSFQLVPAFQGSDGSSRALCAVNVSFAAMDTPATVLQRASDAVNADGGCQSAGVSSVLDPGVTFGATEDDFPHRAHVSLSAPGLTGAALTAAVRTMPGQGTGVCFGLDRIDDPVRGRVRSMKLQFTTAMGGATGGSVQLIERSSLGECSITMSAPAGANAAGVASAVASAFAAPGIPGPNPDCPSPVNPRDVTAQGDSVLTALASELVVCIGDPAVGASVLPTDVCTTNADCDDANPCTTDTCNAATGLCQSTNVPDGQTCDDANACTIGNTCQSGSCGTPVSCDDHNPCTVDACDPATGRCSNTTKSCDDGNPCTVDSCSAATGGCVFTPTPGASCSDGSPCTIGDTCVTTPGNPVPVCQGQPKCDDGNPCTADYCDAASGTCSNVPIVCDDGNPCTTDTCQAGTCVSTPVFGAACDDGNRCTTGDVCVASAPGGPPVCQGTALACDDGNACTVDACDAVSGACTHQPGTIAEVAGLRFVDRVTLTWPALASASSYDTYRGSIPAGGLGSRPAAGPLYDQSCFERGDSHGDGPLISRDTQVPAPGTGFYYLVSQVAPCGEGPLGSDSNGTPIPNSSPCGP